VTAVTQRPDGAPVRRGLLLVCLGVWAAFLAWILLWPTGRPAGWVVSHAAQALWDVGLSQTVVTGSRVEFVLNAAMVVPLVLLAALLWPRWRWERWTAYAFVVSCSVELAQGLWLPLRSAQYVDVVANTLGAGAGAIVGQLVVLVAARRRSLGPTRQTG
jgi:hypothetical protein